MEVSEAIEMLLPSFSQYYTINKDSPVAPFYAEAEFRSHNEQYFLVRSAHIADIDSNEFVFFATPSNLDEENLNEFIQKAWQEGLSRVKPFYGHKNSDVTLIIICDTADNSAKNKIKKTKLSKSYKFSIYGWSNFKLIAAVLKDEQLSFNRFGKDYMALINKNLFNKKK